LLELVSLFRELRLNQVLVEWEDTFPWKCDERFRGRAFYSREEVRRFAEACGEAGIEVVPLVQSLGHAENVLSKDGYEALREVPHRTDCFHPLHPDSAGIVRKMVAEVLELLPEVKRFHLGGDEAYTLGQHPASRAFVGEYGMAALYLRQLEPLIAELEGRKIRPILWHDEFVGWPDEDLRKLAPRVDLMVWGYTGDPSDATTYHHRLPHAQKLAAAGFPLWAATAYKGAEGANADLADVEARERATLGWVRLQEEYGWVGVVATAWSRYASGRIQTVPIDAALDSLVNTAVVLHDGEPPEGGAAACREWLNGAGEGAGFERCRGAMAELTKHVEKAWEWIRHLEEQTANLEIAPERAHSGIEEILLNLLGGEIGALEKVAVAVEESLRGRVMAPFAEHYHLERRRAIEAAAARLRERLG
jgi:hypothetical protein